MNECEQITKRHNEIRKAADFNDNWMLFKAQEAIATALRSEYSVGSLIR